MSLKGLGFNAGEPMFNQLHDVQLGVGATMGQADIAAIGREQRRSDRHRALPVEQLPVLVDRQHGEQRGAIGGMEVLDSHG
ncbi:hypothetical protein D9M69_601150 [compost metagenome]